MKNKIYVHTVKIPINLYSKYLKTLGLSEPLLKHASIQIVFDKAVEDFENHKINISEFAGICHQLWQEFINLPNMPQNDPLYWALEYGSDIEYQLPQRIKNKEWDLIDDLLKKIFEYKNYRVNEK